MATTHPPDETVGTAAATELYDLLRVAVDATRIATWRPGDSLESLLAPAVVAIAAEAGKAVRPHADQVRAETIRGFAGFRVTWGCDWMSLWCPRCPENAAPVWPFGDNSTGVAEMLEAMSAHNDGHDAAQEPKAEPGKENT
jgi:hypothetical protein